MSVAMGALAVVVSVVVVEGSGVAVMEGRTGGRRERGNGRTGGCRERGGR